MDEELIFAKAVNLPVSKRTGFLDGVYDQRPDARAKMEALIRAHETGDSLLDAGGLDSTNDYPAPDSTEGGSSVGWDKIGNYKLLQKIGEGGFGIVYMAEQVEPVKRKVALKVIKPGMDSQAVVARFEAERQALALMEHQNIARVFDGGAIGSESESAGRPYFVMELVKGVPITNYCDDNRLCTSKRLELFIDVCKAVQHAHQKGVIHRDIKPSNVMVTLHDGKPVVKVIDFGVAKAMHVELTEKTLFTAYGQMIGTPQYMSPEQAEMSGLDIDTRSDVYSLGVLLYELLTGTPPLETELIKKVGFIDLQQMIKETEPPKPSARISSSGARLTHIAEHRSVSVERLGREIRGDLDWVVMKSLEKDRTRRYDSPSRLAEDLQNYLSGLTINARPPTLAYRMLKSWRRNRAVLSGVTTVIAVLTVGLAAMWVQNTRLRSVIQSWREDIINNGLEAAFRADIDAVESIVNGQSAKEAELPAHWGLLMQGLATQFEGDTVAAQSIYQKAKDYAPDSIAIRSAHTMCMINRRIDQNEWQEMVLELAPEEIPDGPYQEFDALLFGWSQVYVDPHRSATLLRQAVKRPSPIGYTMLAQAIAHQALDKTDPNERELLALEAINLVERAEKLAGENPFVESIGLFVRCTKLQILGRESFSLEELNALNAFADSIAGKPNLWQGANILSHYYALVEHPDAIEQFESCLSEDWAGACAAAYLWEHGREVPLPNYSKEREFPQPYALVAEACIDVESHPEKASEYVSAIQTQFESINANTFALEIYLHAEDVQQAQNEAKKLLASLTEHHAPLVDGAWSWDRKRLQIVAGTIGDAGLKETMKESKIFQCYAYHLLGLLARASGDDDGARQHFQSAVDSGQFYIPQYYMSRALLSRM